MPLCQKNGRNVIFVHIPKTGGTSVNRFLGENTTVLLYFKGTPTGLKCPPQHLEAESLMKILPIEKMSKIFSIVRHPEDRLISEFLSRYRMSKFRPYIESIPLELARQWLRNAYFFKWALKSFSRYRKDPYYLSNHIRPQTHFLMGDRHCILKLEENGVDQSIDFICNSLLLSDCHNSAKRFNSSPSYPIGVPYLLRRKVEEFYSEDYERFGYERRS